jgi:hypothetical protein
MSNNEAVRVYLQITISGTHHHHINIQIISYLWRMVSFDFFRHTRERGEEVGIQANEQAGLMPNRQ